MQHLANVQVMEAAVGSSSGNVSLIHTGMSWGTRTERLNGDGVRIVTIPEVVRAAGEGFILLIVKVDIEGFEQDLFAENTD